VQKKLFADRQLRVTGVRGPRPALRCVASLQGRKEARGGASFAGRGGRIGDEKLLCAVPLSPDGALVDDNHTSDQP